MRLIITYKFVKGPISLAIACALTFASAQSMEFLQHLIVDLTDLGPFTARVGHWLHAHLTHSITGKAALLAWLDGSSTVIEGILLATGRGWAEWVVVAVLGMLIPFELYGFIRHPSLTRAAVVGVNALVVAYLAWRRLQAERAHLHALHARTLAQTAGEPPPQGGDAPGDRAIDQHS
jgi:uncharacterized membrane protein (DUF2068 family)